MTFASAVRTCFSKYLIFSGRARRREYWYFILFIILGSFAAGLIDQALFGIDVVATGEGTVVASNNGPIGSLFGLIVLIPSLSAGWRRMHDTGRSGLFLLYPMIVMVGIVTFAGLLGGFSPLLAGDFGALIAGGSALVIGVALIIFFVSPLIVIWWLARPTEPSANAYGPVPEGKA
ncbi:Inner membrane protein YhaH [Rhodobacteraceae bacterium THAF1]|uniref:DUF805 domain-containing protein n=1 Tax=Palleronia sp. THAF1 TaxID=2587842 RepID=UPI000F3D537B|nr:DUF805 domain-containing protein [Palleronia sp. THAF1]QFU07844.1 Inner membrane protein YhaH [Palleronia sp. THAF1]VDC25678.1 Inner membrane protein YhaH [Rhodobacteraceae bacterium THAF1]